MDRSKTRWAAQRTSSSCSRATKSMSGGTGVNTGEGGLCGAGTGAPATSERIEAMDRPPSALPANLVLAQEPYRDDGPQWLVAHGEAEIVMRSGTLDADERGLTAAMFDPPQGAFVVPRRGDAAGPPAGGVGVRALRPGVGQIRRLWVDPAARGQGIAQALMARVEDAARELGLHDLR